MTGLSALAAHLDYTAPEHQEDCTAAGWEVDYRLDTAIRESAYSGHSCPVGTKDKTACGHGGEYKALTVRIYCPKCGAATKLEAELPGTPTVYDTPTPEAPTGSVTVRDSWRIARRVRVGHDASVHRGWRNLFTLVGGSVIRAGLSTCVGGDQFTDQAGVR
ncbi:hypothetical protein ABZ923_35985 [Streptomyces sp. NPDC046881]|uniref:hypothetical protein n=1 Tax=Streptomyces sp. NPDC046881 TaxID=3155374 RepID=UPI0033CA6BF6